MVNQYLLLMRYEGLSSFYYFTVPFETQRMGLAQTPTEENCEPTTRQIDLAIGSPSQYISRYHSPIEARDSERGIDSDLIHTPVENEAMYSDDTESNEGVVFPLVSASVTVFSLTSEIMQINTIESEWRLHIKAGDFVDASNPFKNWSLAEIADVRDGNVLVEYLNMERSWQQWISSSSLRIALAETRASTNSVPIRQSQSIEVYQDRPGSAHKSHLQWMEAIVEIIAQGQIYVRYVDQPQRKEWVPIDPSRIAPVGQHSRRCTSSHSRLSSVESTLPRNRMIQAQNPRFLHYRESLLQHNLKIFTVDGDGNCLFRSVSHQVYGNDKYHEVVRRYCVDYMESERDYFEPYVVGNMDDFLRYLKHKRKNGVWGDDPEIQALCELYDRPAEVYTYDAVDGFCKLRTFHEHSTLSRSRPAIRLSYYGGGHYDSIIGPDHRENLIREEPGGWERIHLNYSRHLVQRRQTSSSLEGALAYRLEESDRESTEVAQLQQILQLSRSNFDAMNSSLEDTLMFSLRNNADGFSEDEEMEQARKASEIIAVQADMIASVKEQSEEEELKRAIECSLQDASNPSDLLEDEYEKQYRAAVKASLHQHDTNDTNMWEDKDSEIKMLTQFAIDAKEIDSRSNMEPQLSTNAAELREMHLDELEELQRAIQASLKEA
uniref:ubiquitinyl hydrolase 1 n=1 Tax=Albugo laibachii Nc14 TaxID=890382 RepID=F0X013_9STRA|nr:conserved hypothetical protein [Albugo laibachii Nc14]|eukprot:CCA27095.1 conserved hypothetical protein [Albugo laibachii Nc14]